MRTNPSEIALTRQSILSLKIALFCMHFKQKMLIVQELIPTYVSFRIGKIGIVGHMDC